jgi:hypothetical protein
MFRPPFPRLLLGIQFPLDLGMRNLNESPHKIRELAEVAFDIRSGGANSLTRHTRISVSCLPPKVNAAM